ncbi:hypothetical protein IT157_08405 [bacterium]|nr:hypothetical protein [bacterium]
MTRIRITLLSVFLTVAYAFSQPLPIDSIQFTTAPDGASPLAGQTVHTGGIVTAVNYGAITRYFISDRDGGQWSGIYVFDTQDRGLAIGDSISIEAQVQESGSQTRLRNIVFLADAIPASGSVPPSITETGALAEAHEGVFIEFDDAIVTQVLGEEFVVNDGSGEARVSNGFPFAYEPLIGDTLSYLRGIVTYGNGIFAVNPRGDQDLGFNSNRAPIISEVTHTPDRPTAAEPVTVTARIFDETGISEVLAFYRHGESGDLAAATMHDDGAHNDGAADDGVFAGMIPAGQERTTTYFYISARDAEGVQGISPADAPDSLYSYFVRSISLTIFDIQYVNSPTGGPSPYDGQEITVVGIVTGSGYEDSDFFMSDPGGGPWSGVFVFGPPTLPAEGDCVRVTARVQEYNEFTELSSVSEVTILGSGVVPPPDTIHAGMLPDSAEAYEGGFVYICPSIVTNTDDYGSYAQWNVRDETGEGVIVGNFPHDYVPAVDDSSTFTQGCVHFHTTPGHMIAPRRDSDMGVIDRRAPELLIAQAVTDNRVNLRFNERLSPVAASLEKFEIIEVTNPEFPVLHIQSAQLFSDGRTIQIETLESLPQSSAYQITAMDISDVAGNFLEEALMGFGGFTPSETVAIADIYNDFHTYEGRPVTLRGVVNFVQDVTTSSGSRRISAFMQDESGRGFNLSQTGAASLFPGIQRGNLIEITGIASEYQGAIQLGEFASGVNSADVRVIAENMPLFAPIEVRTGDLRTQASIVAVPGNPGVYGSGTWCRATGTIYQVDENVGGGTNIFIDDGSGNLTIRIWDSMYLDSVYDDSQWIPLGELVGHRVGIAGPSSTYNGDFQMLAGYSDDFTDPDLVGAPSGKLILDVPNRPFAPDLGQKLRISYDSPPTAATRLRLFNMRGQLVHTFVDKRAGGPQVIEWDGRDELRELLPLGTYILHLESIKNGDTESVTKPVVVGTKL